MDNKALKTAAVNHPTEIMYPYDAIMETAGFEAVCAFADHLGGLTVYVPSARTIFSRCIEAEARNEYNGHNLKMLSKKFGFTERHLYRVLQK